MNIGELIHNRRIELKLTLEEIGYAVGVSKSTVKKWEDGFISNMKRDKIASLAKVLKINPVSLITGELILHTDEKEFTFTTHEKKVITAYRQQPTLQEAVDRLLGVSDNEMIAVPIAARSSDNRPIEIAYISKEQLEKLNESNSVEDEVDL